ncbi:hypothetical protein GCM10009865_37310 [Aeromicrobium ponti]
MPIKATFESRHKIVALRAFLPETAESSCQKSDKSILRFFDLAGSDYAGGVDPVEESLIWILFIDMAGSNAYMLKVVRK